jgi:hypothetical protein
MLCERFGIEPDLLPFQSMALVQDFCLVVGRDFVPFADVVEFACLIRLGTILLWKQEKPHSGLDRPEGKRSVVAVPSAQWKRPALVKSFNPPAAGLSFCFLFFLSRAGVLGGKCQAWIFYLLKWIEPLCFP